MMTLRLDDGLAQKIEWASESLKISKSELIRRSVVNYLEQISKPTPWELGKDLFGKFDSGVSTLAETRKNIVKQKMQEKYQ